MSNTTLATTKSPRRHDLDWIRVIVFWLLIVFHVALGFVDRGIYSYQNNETAGALMDLFLQFLHQWRLPVLFLISGMGTSFAFRRRTGKQFLWERSKRLLIPLLFGVLFVNLFSGYYAALEASQTGMGTEAGPALIKFAVGWWAHFGNVQHLWFLVNLFKYSLLCAPLFIYLRNRPDGFILRGAHRIIGFRNGLGLLFLVPLPLILVELFIKPWAFGGLGRGYEFLWYLVFFFTGYLLIMAGDTYWKALEKIRYMSLVVGIGCSMLLFGLKFLGNTITPGYGGLILNGGWTRLGDSFWNILTFPALILHSLNAWSWCMAVFSWGARNFTRPSQRLSYFNQAVYPFYIVHMPIILATLYYMKDWEMWWPLKLLLITSVTFAGCWAVFEIVKRNRVTRMLFGIKSLVPKPITGLRPANNPPEQAGDAAES